MKTPTIRINITYSRCTPESVDAGDYSESGFESQGEEMTFRELHDYMRRHGFTYCSDSHPGPTSPVWFSTEWATIDYRTGETEEKSIHFDRGQPERLRRWFNLAGRIASR
jgi:hypothetical protein